MTAGHQQTTRVKTLALLLAMAAMPVSRFAFADLAPPNANGIAMGHVHFTAHDVESNLSFWTALGGKAVQRGDTWLIRFPDIIVALSQGDYEGNSHGAVVDHIAFRVQSLARIEQAGFELQYFPGSPGVATTHTPEGERVEFFDEQATNLSFTVDAGEIDEVADRHNRKLDVPITSHHMHLFVPEAEVQEAKNWYVDVFGGVPGKRWHYEAVDLPGINLNFSAAKEPVGPTKGRMLDHIGFEVADLETVCRKLRDKGTACNILSTTMASGIKSAFITDPWGTWIELTEGLGALP